MGTISLELGIGSGFGALMGLKRDPTNTPKFLKHYEHCISKRNDGVPAILSGAVLEPRQTKTIPTKTHHPHRIGRPVRKGCSMLGGR